MFNHFLFISVRSLEEFVNKVKAVNKISDAVCNYWSVRHLIATTENHNDRNLIPKTDLKNDFISFNDSLFADIEAAKRVSSHAVSASIVYQKLRSEDLNCSL